MPRTRPLESSLLNPWVFSRSSSCAGPSEPLRPGPDAEDEVAGVIEPMFFFSKQLLRRPIRAAAARRVGSPGCP